MGRMTGSATADISAPMQRCFDIAADVDNIADWQRGVVGVNVLERDADGRALVAAITNDAKVRTITVKVRFRYDAPRGLSWSLVKGDLKSMEGSWVFAEAPGGTTRATYNLALDPGMMLGMLARGPVVDKVRDILVSHRPDELKGRAEAGTGP
jgi:ribosome-associated toxin RatA of RatAB toxin-antitoxin module